MKKSVLNALFVLSAFALKGQSQPYNFSVSSEPYSTLTNATVLPASEVWDLEESIAPIGFDFQFDDASIDQIYVLGYLGALVTDIDFTPGLDAIFGYSAYSLINGPGTEVRYRTDGTAPNRVFKVEWYKAAFTDADGNISFQIWLYEGSNDIQVRIGSGSIPDPVNTFFNETSPLIGLMVDYVETLDGYTIGYSHWVVGSPTNPTDTIIQTLYEGEDMPPFGCDGIPQENLVLTFSTSAVGTSTLANAEPLGFYPNPVVDVLHFNEPAEANSSVQIFDATGRILFNENYLPGASTCQIPAHLPAGTYWLSRTCGGKISVAQFIKG